MQKDKKLSPKQLTCWFLCRPVIGRKYFAEQCKKIHNRKFVLVWVSLLDVKARNIYLHFLNATSALGNAQDVNVFRNV